MFSGYHVSLIFLPSGTLESLSVSMGQGCFWQSESHMERNKLMWETWSFRMLVESAHNAAQHCCILHVGRTDQYSGDWLRGCSVGWSQSCAASIWFPPAWPRNASEPEPAAHWNRTVTCGKHPHPIGNHHTPPPRLRSGVPITSVLGRVSWLYFLAQDLENESLGNSPCCPLPDVQRMLRVITLSTQIAT